MITRRAFTQRVTSAVALLPLLGSTIITTACNGGLYNQILSYVTVGLNAFQSIVDILIGAKVIPTGEGTAIDVVIALVKAGFADVAAAVQAYLDAPADQKQSLLGKISTAISVVMAQLQQFWSDLKIPDAGLSKLVQGLLGIILAVLAGFQARLPAPASTSVATKSASLPNKLTVQPKTLTPAEFKKEFNNLLDQNGQSSHKIF